MEIIFASTGVECVAAPSRGVIYLDPTLDYESAVGAIQASLPGVHVDAIRHWVEKAMPSATPLSRRAQQAPPRSHRRESRLRRAMVALALFAVGAGAMYGGLHLKQRFVDSVFANPVFAELAKDRGWRCDRGIDYPMNATCLTGDGLRIFATAYVSDRQVAFNFNYERSNQAYVNRLLAFDTSQDAVAWRSLLDEDSRPPNLVTGTVWALYGDDAEKVRFWSSVLPQA